jgi:hypothetical protein
MAQDYKYLSLSVNRSNTRLVCDEIMHMFVASGVCIQMSPLPPPFTMMGRKGYATDLKITLSQG